MTQTINDDDDLIYAEYALGVLDASERARVEQSMRADAMVSAAVGAWEERLAPLNDEIAPVVPGEHVWQRVCDRLDGRREMPVTRARDRVPFWRALAVGGWMTGGVAAAALVALLVLKDPVADPAAGVTALAALGQPNGPVHWTVTLNAAQRRLALTPVPALSIPAGRSAELWLIAPGSTPVSLGVVPVDRPVSVPLSSAVYAQLAVGTVLAVSVEPLGGSPTGAPTGEVISSGPLRGI